MYGHIYKFDDRRIIYFGEKAPVVCVGDEIFFLANNKNKETEEGPREPTS